MNFMEYTAEYCVEDKICLNLDKQIIYGEYLPRLCLR